MDKSNADIYLANFNNETIILKLIDLAHENFEYLFKEMQNEIRVYETVKSLQDRVIPELKAYGCLKDGRFALGLSNCGSPPEWSEEENEKALKTLKAFHEAGFVHNDV